MSETTEFPWNIQHGLHGRWDEFVDFVAPLRPDMHRYCRRLTGNVWDGEDLVQDTVVKVFAVLGKRHAPVLDARAYMIRVATNLWIDRARRREAETAALAVHAESEEARVSAAKTKAEKSEQVRAAARELLERLTPQERAAFLMKDVFDLSLEETASVLRTTVGAVKTALHRGRGRLDESTPARARVAPREVVDRVFAAFCARDLDALNALVSEDIAVELVGGAVAENREESQTFFYFSMNAHPGVAEDTPRFEMAEFEGEPLILGFRQQGGVEGLNEIHRVEVDGDKVTRIRCYCFCPDTLDYFGEILGIPVNKRPYRSPSLPT